MSFPAYEEFQKDFDFSKATKIGQGSFGQVFKVKSNISINQKPPMEYAVKFIETPNEQTFKFAMKEYEFSTLINIHPNVINIEKVYAWSEAKPVKKYYLVLILELAVGNLKSELTKHQQTQQNFSDKQINAIFQQCIQAFGELANEKSLYHRDIKPENILLASIEPLVCKLADFGVSKALTDERIARQQTMSNTLVGTPIFLSPLLWVAYVNGGGKPVKHNLEKSDVFSLGLSLIQLVLLLPDQALMQCNDPLIPKDDGTFIDTTHQIDQIPYSPGYKKLEKLFDRITSENIKKCLIGMLHFDESKRFTWKQALAIFKSDLKPQKFNHPTQLKASRQFTYQVKQTPKLKIFQSNQSPWSLLVLGQFASNLNANIRGILYIKSGICVYGDDGLTAVKPTQNMNILKKSVIFATVIEISNQIVGITSSGTFFSLDINSLQVQEGQISRQFEAQKITKFKHMRRNLVLISLMDGRIVVMDYEKFPPSAIASFQDTIYDIIDFAYHDSNKLLISSDGAKGISGRILSDELVYYKVLDYEVQNLQFLNETNFVASSISTNEILQFTINTAYNNLSIQPIKIYSQITGPAMQLLTIDEIFIATQKELLVIFDKQDKHLIIKQFPYTLNSLTYQDDILYGYDQGTQSIIKLTINNQEIMQNFNRSTKKCKCCTIF